MAVLEELQHALEDAATRAGDAVVGVGRRWALGSGVVAGPGRVVTNAHNLRGGEVTVTFNGGRTATATPAGVDVDGDIAVLDVDTGDAPAPEWSDAHAAVGMPVFALSNPGGRGLRVTFGFVSGTERSFRGPRGRRIRGSVEHTAPLLPGSSGGPVVDASGRLLGINTNRLGEGFYLAIPADGALKERIDRLGRGETSTRPRLGIGVAPPHVARGLRKAVGLPEADGVLVRVLENDSPAAAAGIREGDLITAVGGEPVTSIDDLHDALDGARGDIAIKLLRGVDEVDVTATISES